MQEYLLFIDTETTGLPHNWNAPHSAVQTWPSALQISWIIYNNEQEELKREDYYIRDNPVSIDPKAAQIHHLSPSFLQENGKPQLWVMQKLADDLNMYRPLVIGHFVELDYHILSADFYRCAIQNPLKSFPLFCTMLASSKYVKKPWVKYLRLAELYSELFHKKLAGSHNAAIDVEATAQSFFEMLRRNDITEQGISDQQKRLARRMRFLKQEARLKYWGLSVLLLVLVFLVFYLLILE